jgi:hypothetical protein
MNRATPPGGKAFRPGKEVAAVFTTRSRVRALLRARVRKRESSEP